MTAPRNLLEVIQAGADYLDGKKVESPRLACELLAGRLLGRKRLELYLEHETELTEKQLAAMRRGIKRVAAGEPVQYVTGCTEFHGHRFVVDPRALIPRPETELLVERVLACEPLWQQQPVLLDVGTGSGCIIISIALARPAAVCIGFDISADALALAAENAAALGVQDRVVFTSQELSDTIDPEMLDAVVANLPYVPTAEVELLPVHIRDHEPRAALDGGPDGLAVIEPVLQDAAIMLKPGGWAFLETGEDQGAAVTALLKQNGFGDIILSQDLAGHDRIIQAQLTSP